MSNSIDQSDNGLSQGTQPGAEALEEREKACITRVVNEFLAGRAERNCLQTELAEAKKTIGELSDIVEKMRKAQRNLESERDGYLKALYAMTRTPFTFTEDELHDLEANGHTLDEVLHELAATQEGQLVRLQTELEGANKTIGSLKAQGDQFASERSSILAERDQYLRSLYALLPEEWYNVADEELEAQQREGGVTFEEIMKAIVDATRD